MRIERRMKATRENGEVIQINLSATRNGDEGSGGNGGDDVRQHKSPFHHSSLSEQNGAYKSFVINQK